MNFKTYTDRKKRKGKKLTGIIVILVILLAGTGVVGILTSDGPEYQARKSMIEENHALKEEIAELKADNEKLKKELKKKNEYIKSLPEPEEEETIPTPTPSQRTAPRN